MIAYGGAARGSMPVWRAFTAGVLRNFIIELIRENGDPGMSVSSIIGGGIRLIQRQPQVVAIWAAIYVVVITLGVIAMQTFMSSMMAVHRPAAVVIAAGIQTPTVFPATQFGTIAIIELAFLALGIIAFAAVVRAVARPGGDRFAYLRIGMDELRLLGLGVLLLLMIFVGEFIAIAIVAAASGIFAAIGAGFVGAIFGIALFCASIYAQVRISLAGAMTVIEGRIVIKDAWRATKGHFWTLFGAYLVMTLVYLVVTVIILVITSPQLVAAYASLNPQTIQAAVQSQYASQGVSLTRILSLVVSAVLAVPMGIVLCGGIATAAVELGGVPHTIADEF